jgi:tRNA nucleotidyltransferase (CCA-adding enzyme)
MSSASAIPLLEASCARAVVAIAKTLREAGFSAWLVGEPLARSLAGVASGNDVPLLATPASLDELLALFPTAVPTRPLEGAVLIPGPDGPVDVCEIGAGRDLETELRGQHFSVCAMAWDPLEQQLHDPFGGRADLAGARLRTIGDAAELLRALPECALRAARLVAQLGLRASSELEAALGLARLEPSARTRLAVRANLSALLLSPGAAAGLELLERSGFTAHFVPKSRSEVSKWIADAPADLEARLAAWLHGTRASAWLRVWRFGHGRSHRVLELLDHHPLDERIDARRDAVVQRLLRRVSAADIEVLFALREVELRGGQETGAAAERARARLDAVRRAIARVENNRAVEAARKALAVDGRTLMAHLGCEPGREVGAALKHLAERVAASPELNRRDRLLAEIDLWRAKRDPA